ncbi:MAG: methylmalonyl-CoA mutase family protein [Reichenbachiella sp.]|uniref:methylmalonyl-CoA mutase family protein n=1 Tax=Reichenbachiella sp. TaxID=2184521 RepID=UPI00296776E2|nr:methylmalonyl-CoA mutase family protein [Reichenbachiella sp.]MDW3211068.1 methylmalonyl-CoA mutase family protein [Reichenbachiella sp.]
MIKEYNFDEFDKASKKEWTNKLIQDLGTDTAQRISEWKCERELSLSAYYNEEDLKDTLRIPLKKTLDWKYLQPTGFNTTNDEALNALMNGADGLILENSQLNHLEKFLNKVSPEYCTLALRASSFDDYQKFLNWWKNRHPKDGAGEVLVFHLSRSIESTIEQDHTSLMEDLLSASVSGHRVINIDCGLVQRSGGGVTSELSYMISQSIFIINHLIDKGHSLDKIINSLFVSTDIGSSYLLELSKIRVMRWLLAQVLKQYGVTEANILIHASTSPFTKSALDANTNFLRCTSESMSAILGGADYLTIDPHHSLSSADRIARNISNLLKDESYLSKTMDPATGSYYMEDLSKKLAQEAWGMFQEMESKGGYLVAVKEKVFQSEITKDLNFQKERIASGRRKVVGVNDFGNPDEKIKSDQLSDTHKSLSADFERVRKEVEKFVETNGEENRPSVYLAAAGVNAKMINARYTFVTNFFNWAGFRISKIESHEIPKEFSVMVCCGADENYNKESIQEIAGIDHAKIVLAAGQCNDDSSSRISGWVNVKSNRLQTVQDLLNKLGVTQNSSWS